MNLSEYDIKDSIGPSEIKRASFVSELHSVIKPIQLFSQIRGLTKDRRGQGQRIILIPGWKSHETVMYPIKKYLAFLGYAPEYWGLGINHGNIERYRDTMVEQLMAQNSEEQVTLIGWSLGGLVAREIAREIPNKVSSVITYGTPVIGGPRYTIGNNFYRESEIEAIIEQLEELDRTNPIKVPMSIIFTKKDSFVAWPACLDKTSKNVKHYEVDSTHLSLGIDPQVWKIVARHLAQEMGMVAKASTI
ncbi:MAG: alpha/beta hydrolase [Bacteroidota bacterium]